MNEFFSGHYNAGFSKLPCTGLIFESGLGVSYKDLIEVFPRPPRPPQSSEAIPNNSRIVEYGKTKFDDFDWNDNFAKAYK